jgi:hypothetical protein
MSKEIRIREDEVLPRAGTNEMDEVESIIHQMVADSDVPIESVAYIIIGDDEDE